MTKIKVETKKAIIEKEVKKEDVKKELDKIKKKLNKLDWIRIYVNNDLTSIKI